MGLAAMLAVACTAPEAVVDMEAETAALRATAQAYHDAAANEDTEALVDLYAPDAVMYPPDLPAVEGIDAVREYAGGFTSVPGIQIQLDLVEVVVSPGADMGYTLGTGTIIMDGPDGEPVTEHVRDFHVWTKNAAGEWKLVVDIWNSPVPLEEPVG